MTNEIEDLALNKLRVFLDALETYLLRNPMIKSYN